MVDTTKYKRQEVCLGGCGKIRWVKPSEFSKGLRTMCRRCSYDSKRKVIVGQKYGKLTVTARPSSDVAVCICDCGNTANVYPGNLLGNTSSCGCVRKRRRHRLPIGHVIGMLTVKSEVVGDGSYLCECACGTVKQFQGSHLRSCAFSCGCVPRMPRVHYEKGNTVTQDVFAQRKRRGWGDDEANLPIGSTLVPGRRPIDRFKRHPSVSANLVYGRIVSGWPDEASHVAPKGTLKWQAIAWQESKDAGVKLDLLPYLGRHPSVSVVQRNSRQQSGWPPEAAYALPKGSTKAQAIEWQRRKDAERQPVKEEDLPI